VELLPPAKEAVAAGGPIGAQHAVADLDARHLVADRNHLADVLVPDDEAGLDLDAPVVDVEVRAADPAGLDADDRVVRRQQLGLLDLVYLHLTRRLEGHCTHERSV
jgi:hypothetical protein